MGILWASSGQIARDDNDARATGAKAYFYLGGTTTPLVVYQNAAETTPHTAPVEADGSGRWPAVFIPYTTSYDVKVTTSSGTQLYYYVEIPNPDPVDVASGAVTTSSAQLFQTGMMVFEPKTGTRSGWVRANGRTIGSSASGATELANDTTAADLYTYLWNNFANTILAVSTGRGASAAADFVANKTIALFDMRGGVPRGVDDMGNSAASALTLATFTTGDAITGGSLAGVNTHTLTSAQLAAHTHGPGTLSTDNNSANHTHSGTTSGESFDHTHAGGSLTTDVAAGGAANGLGVIAGSGASNISAGAGISIYNTAAFGTMAVDSAGWSGATGTNSVDHTHTVTTGTQSANHTHNVIAGVTGSTGSGSAHNNVSKSILGNWLIKL